MATTATYDGPVPIQGYDKLELRHLFPQLRLRSQVELTHIDGYERAHQDRPAVLSKLRYLRNDEPIEGYDTLDSEQVLAALADADTPTLAAARDYEQKLRARETVLAGIAELRARNGRPETAPEAADEPTERWPGDNDGPIKSTVVTVGILVMIVAAVALLVVLLGILAFVLITAVAPDLLIG